MLKKRTPIVCKNCAKEHIASKNSKGLYCSVICQQDFQNNQKIKDGIASQKTMKRYLLSKFGNKCFCCGITDWNDKPITMEIEHKDGNSSNNEIENLSLLCPNCHSQTPTYKNKNKGNGRHYRRLRYSQNKSY